MVRPTHRDGIGEMPAALCKLWQPSFQICNACLGDAHHALFALPDDKCASGSRRSGLLLSLAFLSCLKPLREVHVDGCRIL